MTCREFIEFLMEYLGGELPPAVRDEFDAHLGECPDCQAYLDAYRTTVRLGKLALDDPDGPVPAEAPADLVRAILAVWPPVSS